MKGGKVRFYRPKRLRQVGTESGESFFCCFVESYLRHFFKEKVLCIVED